MAKGHHWLNLYGQKAMQLNICNYIGGTKYDVF